MSTPFLCEIRIMSYTYAPKGWAQCNGQLLPINQNQPLFSLLGTMYGGDGRVNFALPDLRGRVPIHMGDGFTQGERGGQESHTLIQSELPAHNHVVQGNSGTANAGTPVANVWASQDAAPYGSSSNVAMNPTTTGSTGGNQPHNNLSPYLVLNFCIALQGIFPSQT